MAPIVVHEIPSPVPDAPPAAALPAHAWFGHVLWWLVLALLLTPAIVAVAQPS
jgi:hypothetical protein